MASRILLVSFLLGVALATSIDGATANHVSAAEPNAIVADDAVLELNAAADAKDFAELRSLGVHFGFDSIEWFGSPSLRMDQIDEAAAAKIFEIIRHNDRITDLSIYRLKKSEVLDRELPKLKHLRALSFFLSELGPSTLKAAAKIDGLTKLTFGTCRFEQGSLPAFAEFRNLTSFSLLICDGPSGDLFTVLAGLKQLTYVVAMGRKLSDDDLAPLRHFERLSCLDLSGTNVTDAVFAVAGGIPRLDTINVIDTRTTAAAAERYRLMYPKRRVAHGSTARAAQGEELP